MQGLADYFHLEKITPPPFFSLVTNIFARPGSSSKSTACDIHAWKCSSILPPLKEKKKKEVIFVSWGSVPEPSWLTRLQTRTTRGADLSALIQAKPRQNKMGIAATRKSSRGWMSSPRHCRLWQAPVLPQTGENLWKWKQSVETDGRWSLSVPCSNQVKPCRAEFKANVPYKSPGFPGPPNEN